MYIGFVSFFLLMLMVNSVFVPYVFKSPIGCHVCFRCKGETNLALLCVYPVGLLFRSDSPINSS